MAEPAPKNAPLKIEGFGATHSGRVRPINEDRFLCSVEHGVFAVADGMGGHAHGDIASSAIIQAIDERISMPSAAERVEAFSQSIVDANKTIRDISAANGNIIIGSTAAGLVIFPSQFFVFWTGDSRVYLLREGRIQQLTYDHTEAQILLRQGKISEATAREWPRKNVIVHAIGVNEEPYIEVTRGELRRGDVFLLCTDGLTNHVTDAEINQIAPSRDAKAVCVDLIRLALERGGTDNVTVIAVTCN
jgi:serine/threonine protein phosphatase PrpC